MMAHKKKWQGCIAGAALGLAVSTAGAKGLPKNFMGLTAYGASSSVIENMSVSVKTSWGDAEEILEPEISVSGSGISLIDYQYRTDYEDWKPGKKVRIEINVAAEDGKYFTASMGSSKCRVSGATFVSARALDDNTMQVKVDYLPAMVLGNTSEAGWSSTDSQRAVWKEVEYAPGYSLTLYGNDKTVKRMTVTDNSASLGEYMTDPDKIYYYEVKAVPITSAQKKYLKEGEFVTSGESEFDEDEERPHSSGQTQGAGQGGPGDTGSLKGDNFIYPDGTMAVNTWKKVQGQWYYFGSEGSRSRGWLNYGGRWYYMDGNGVMQTGWVNPGNGWYYLGPDGDMITGWVNPGGVWYYLGSDGRMQTGWVFVNGRWYYMNESGAMQTGWINLQNAWYFLHSDGAMAVNTVIDGWQIGMDGVGKEQ